jgi:hypothetical protein
MTYLIAKLFAMTTVPPRGEGKFDLWLEQKDSLDFLARNEREEDCVIYASMSHVFLHSAIVPLSQLTPPDVDDLLKWSCRPSDTWSVWASDNKVGLDPPFENPGSKSLQGAEALIFTRSFEGYVGKKGYVELLQKFAHIFDLHYVSEQSAYCRLDRHGDVVPMVKIGSIDNAANPFDSGRYLTINRELLDDYMFLTGTALVRLFDFTRFHPESFGGWGDLRETTRIDNNMLHARLTIQRGTGSYLRGFQVLRTNTTQQSVIDRIWGREEKRYATFIAQDWKNKRIAEISCDPKRLSNYFTQSELPFEISPAFFKAEVLRKYKADSEKYTLEERSISCRGAWYLQTYDINEVGQVHTYLIYLSRLPYEEQLYWKSFNEPPRGPISKRAYTTDFEGEFSQEAEALSALKYRLRELHRHNVPWWSLRSEALVDKVLAPFTTSADEWADDILKLDQLLIEGFDAKWLRRKCIQLGRQPEPNFGSLKLIEECLLGLEFEGHDARAMVEPLRELHDMRTKLKGHASDDSGRALRKQALADHGSYREQFMDLCTRCDYSVERITAAFEKG